MIRLIKNELYKIFHKKSTYIILIIFLAILTLITGIISSTSNEEIISYEFSENNKEILTIQLQRLDPANDDEVLEFVSTKSKIDIIDFVNEYEEDSWQRHAAESNIIDLIYQVNNAKYVNKDEQELAEKEAVLMEFKNKLDTDDWREYITENKKILESELSNLKNQLSITTDTTTIEELKQNIAIKEIDIEIIDYRLNNNIPYGNDYLNQALSDYEENKKVIVEIDKNNESKSEKEKLADAKEKVAINKYVLDNKVDIEYEYTARNIFKTVISDNMILILIFVCFITGAIVAEEFNKGTIKSLLVKPFKRVEIIIAKYITCILMLIFCTIVICIGQYFIGGFFQGFDSYKIPMVVYNYTTEKVIELPMIHHLINTFLGLLPMLIMTLTLSFAISTIFTSTALGVSIPLLGNFFSEIINILINSKKIEWLRYFPTMTWDLSYFLYGGKSDLVPFSLEKCIIIDIIYILTMLLITVFIFKKKNVKNI